MSTLAPVTSAAFEIAASYVQDALEVREPKQFIEIFDIDGIVSQLENMLEDMGLYVFFDTPSIFGALGETDWPEVQDKLRPRFWEAVENNQIV